MPKRRHVDDFACPIEATVAVIGGKWKTVILHYLSERGTLRFGEIRRLMPTATQQMIVNQLRELEHDGLIIREIFREVPPRVEYSLTPLGRSLSPILKAMKTWGVKFEEKLVAAQAGKRRGLVV